MDAIEPSNYEQAGWSDLTYEYVQAILIALDAEKARADAAEVERDEARATNQSLHRRVQRAESPNISAIAKAEAYKQKGWDSWSAEFDRVMGAHHEMRTVYEIVAPLMGLPFGTYHSVMDAAKNYYPEHIYHVSWMNRLVGAILARPIVGGKSVGPFVVKDVVRDCVARLTARADAADAALKTARDALADAVDVLALAENPAWPDPKYHNEVKSLGLRIGFGALMATASAGWREYLADQGYPTGGEHVAGPCLGTVKATLARMRAVLAALDAKGEPK